MSDGRILPNGGVLRYNLKERVIQAFLYREARFWGAEDVRLFLGRTRPEGWYLGPAEDETIGQGQTVQECWQGR